MQYYLTLHIIALVVNAIHAGYYAIIYLQINQHYTDGKNYLCNLCPSVEKNGSKARIIVVCFRLNNFLLQKLLELAIIKSSQKLIVRFLSQT